MKKNIILYAAVLCGMLQAEFNNEKLADTITVDEIRQVCKDVSLALSQYNGIELCEALKQPYSILQGKGIEQCGDAFIDEIVRLKGHLELLSESWRLERVDLEKSLEGMIKEMDVYWGFTLKQTKELTSIQVEIVAALLALEEVWGNSDMQVFDQREYALLEAYLKRAEFAKTYLKTVALTKRAYIEDVESKETRISYDEIDEQEFFLAVEQSLGMFNNVPEKIKARYGESICAVVQELESLYIPCQQK